MPKIIKLNQKLPAKTEKFADNKWNLSDSFLEDRLRWCAKKMQSVTLIDREKSFEYIKAEIYADVILRKWGKR